MENKTIFFFKQLTQIPRESGNERQVSEYLCNFAKERNLFYQIDDHYNVLIKKKTTDKAPVILQAHTDMVCVKRDDLDFDFAQTPLSVCEENGFLKARGTSLGADNGIGVAQILNILDQDIPCNIEAVFTTEEETSMDGAIHFDATPLRGKMLISLDGFDENTILIGCACFYDILIHFNYNGTPVTEQGYKVTVKGLLGGHSGFDIDKNRGNASILLAQFLMNIPDIKISNFTGGTKFNVIPSLATATFTADQTIEQLHTLKEEFIDTVKGEYPTVEIEITPTDIRQILSKEDSIRFLRSICRFKHGVCQKEGDHVTTSVNLGVVSLLENQMKVGMRSSKKQEERACLDSLRRYAENEQYRFEILGSQPGFDSDRNSTLVQCLNETSPISYYHQNAVLKPVHIAVEAGFFKEKIPDLEIAIISPNIQNAHTIQERVEIASVAACDQWLRAFLEKY